ncbi:hypothetical protein [Vibrio sagamiensis]|uniref:hypothetical protein n=1 Tax=Vibrio sagamiensis TaxID=512650 RepID=UPI0005876D10|nr:hypothetical protein [Vibrio sagamiensis]
MKVLATIILLLTSFMSISGVVTQGSLKVKKILTGYPEGEIYFLVDRQPVNPNNCTLTAPGHMMLLAVDPKRSDVSQVLSVLLTAKASSSNIEIQVYDDYCRGNYGVIRRIAIY